MDAILNSLDVVFIAANNNFPDHMVNIKIILIDLPDFQSKWLVFFSAAVKPFLLIN